MDADHQEHLARILENRRRRGAKAAPFPEAAALAKPVFESPTIPVPDAAVDAAHLFPVDQEIAAPVVQTGVAAEVALLLESQRQLQYQQALQARRVEELQNTVERNFHDLKSVVQLHGPPSPGDISRVRPLVKERSLPSGKRASLPPPFIPASGVPGAARPSAASHLSVKSALAVMRSGDWFLKWSEDNSAAAARFVWLDATRNILLWGKDKMERSIFSGQIELETISNVTTDQITEFDGEVNRLFFLLIIHSSNRRLCLATEKREKLDCWFEAVNIIVLFNRIHLHKTSNVGSSTD